MAETRLSWPGGGRVGDYQILEVVGAGGMGVVYKARDLKLDRIVALKFLPHEAAVTEKERDRFLAEAKAASALDHTNIGVIHGLEQTSDGHLYIVMGFYEGKTLARRIREGPVPTYEAVDLAIQMCSGLAEAHSRNIVHRDIKPSNLIVTDQGLLKIVDFGLALVMSAATATHSLGVAGTVAYMSPEQASGTMVDQRSDIWAAGVVLAEMVTGKHPFQRDSLPAVMMAIIKEPPLTLEGVPLDLQRIILRSLAKDPAKRYQTCKEMLADLKVFKATASAPTQTFRPEDLAKYAQYAAAPPEHVSTLQKAGRWWLVASTAVLLFAVAAFSFSSSVRDSVIGIFSAGAEKHIVVLPFENIGNDPANALLAEGLMESLTGRLSNLDQSQGSLWVVPASFVRQKKVDDPATALRTFGATLAVKGTIARDAQNVHLTVNLINTKTMRQLGSADLVDRGGDLAGLEDQAIAKLAKLMHVSATPDELRNPAGGAAPSAYEGYLKALSYIDRYDKPGNLDLAIGELETAVKADPKFALGFAEECEAYRLKFQLDQNPQWVDAASAKCKQAADLDSRLPKVYVTLGRLHSGQGKDDLALQEFQQALSLNRRDPEAIMGMANAYERMGRAAEAEKRYQEARDLRPDYWDGYNSLGIFYLRQKRYADAVNQFQQVIKLTPDNWQAYSNLGAAYLSQQKLPEAEAALQKSLSLTPSYQAYVNLGSLYFTEKRYADYAATTEKALQLNDKDFRAWANLASAYKLLNQPDKAKAAAAEKLKRLEIVVQVQPKDPVVQSALGIAYAEQKDKDKSLPHILSALALAPDNPQILINSGEAYEDLGDRKHALEFVEKAMKNGYSLDRVKSNSAFQNLLKDSHFSPPAR